MRGQKLAVSLYMDNHDNLLLEFLPDEGTSKLSKAEILQARELNTIMIPACRVTDFCTLASISPKQKSRLVDGFYVNTSINLCDTLFHMM